MTDRRWGGTTVDTLDLARRVLRTEADAILSGHPEPFDMATEESPAAVSPRLGEAASDELILADRSGHMHGARDEDTALQRR